MADMIICRVGFLDKCSQCVEEMGNFRFDLLNKLNTLASYKYISIPTIRFGTRAERHELVNGAWQILTFVRTRPSESCTTAPVIAHYTSQTPRV